MTAVARAALPGVRAVDSHGLALADLRGWVDAAVAAGAAGDLSGSVRRLDLAETPADAGLCDCLAPLPEDPDAVQCDACRAEGSL